MENEILKNFENNMLNEVLKDIVKQTRIDTLRQVLPEKIDVDANIPITGDVNNGAYAFLRDSIQNETIQEIKNKAKELWGLELNNLNK